MSNLAEASTHSRSPFIQAIHRPSEDKSWVARLGLDGGSQGGLHDRDTPNDEVDGSKWTVGG